MTSIVLIDKNCSFKQTKVKGLKRDTLYKKCGFKVSGGFELRTIWKVNIEKTKMNIELWSRDYGKAGTENKYDFPPPVDTALYFGTCAVLRTDDKGDIIDLSIIMWNKIYEKLFGGFEDICDDEDDSEDELTTVPKEMKTKAGYLKDGFVVEDGTDGENDDDDEDDNDDDENEFIYIVGDDDDDNNSVDDIDDEDDNDSEDDSNGGSELDEDVYQYSSDEN
tara:strand:+ start:296 stop:958 length:663 start_codon:yes stop_codon:yes gene_type:complete